ncbi:MAG: VOC family protein [Candidatus Sericytochromatia bacterium]
MNKIFDTYIPEGFSTVNSYLFVENLEEELLFLKNTFYADIINTTVNQDNNEIINCILKIGYSCFMLSKARGQFLNMKSAFYLYVDNVDEIHKRAIENGAKIEFAPIDMPYEDRQSGIIDPSGNYWWISKRLVEKNYN